MSSQPFYHLRPNKYIDRALFIQVLNNLNKILPIQDYLYIGFGSFMFDDFKLMHNQLNITDMISLESDPVICKRANFNKPYSCINIVNSTSSDYISGLELDDKPAVVWLDFTDPKELGVQFADFCGLLDILKPNDIIRITLNANPTSLDGHEKSNDAKVIHEKRFKKLIERINDYIPTDAVDNDITMSNYPLLLLRCLKKAAATTLVVSPPYQNKYLFPLFSSVYKDGQQMLTLTAIIQDSKDKEKNTRECLKNCASVNFEWDKPYTIKVPPLTSKEILHINNLLPNVESSQQIIEKYEFVFDNSNVNESVGSYLDYYKYYPNFHHVNL